MRLVPLFSAHRTIIDAVCSTPFYGYETLPNGTPRRLAPQPNLLTKPLIGTAFTWKQQCLAGLLSDGNAVGLVTGIDRHGYADQLFWTNPNDVTIDDSEPMRPLYYYRGRKLNRGEFVHIPWIVPAGKVRGLSPLKAFQTAFEMGAAAQAMGRDWYVNGAIPSGHLKSNAILDKPAATEAKANFKAAVVGRDVLVTGDDWDYKTIGVPADEARFIESLNLTATQIASIYGLRPEDIGGEATGPSLEYKTIESDERRSNSRIVRPWAVRIEEALTALRPAPEYTQFDLDAMVRADLKTRMEAHEIALRAGVETLPEARRAENRPPLTPDELQQWMNTHGRAPARAVDPQAKGQP